MWSFLHRQTLAESGVLEGITDYHSHILPGVDDGIQAIEDSLNLLILYEQLGIKELWLTPHIMEDYPNDTNILKYKFYDLYTEYKKYSKSHIKMFLASEYMLDSLFISRLNNRDVLPINNNQILIETSYYSPPINFKNVLKLINSNGYIPILAHPERYHYISKIKVYEELYKEGIKFQLDIASLVGAYGEDIRCKAITLVQKGYYSFVGTDTHKLETFKQWINTPINHSVLRDFKKIINK